MTAAALAWCSVQRRSWTNKGINYMIWNIISLIGTIVGIAGTIISIITMTNTKRIKYELTKMRMSADFKVKYSGIKNNLNNYIKFVKEKDMRCETIAEIYRIVKNIQMYSASEKWEKKKSVDDCVNFIKKNYDELARNVTFKLQDNASLPNEKLNGELYKHLIAVLTEIEREGINHDIR